jgi:release factor glutamine methyltransferase
MTMSANSSTTNNWLRAATKYLETAGIGTARLDCMVLLEDAIGKDRAWLLAHPDYRLQGPSLQILHEQLERRARHEPLAYIRGKTEFYGREFLITSDVLEPRPESETMIDLLKGLKVKGEGLRVIDVGTGSGALAITAKLEIPEADVVAIDIDKNCLAVARQNAHKHQVAVDFVQGNLLEPILALSPQPLVLLCNLPYVPADYRLNDAAMMEPQIAIFGGADGLDLYRELFGQIATMQAKPALVLTESLPFQHDALQKIAAHSGYYQTAEEDFIQGFTIG